MKLKLVLIFTIAFVMLSGCVLPFYEPITEDKSEYIGQWLSDDGQMININQNGSGDYVGYDDFGSMSGTISINSGVVTITEANIKIAIFVFEKELAITSPPYKEDGKTKMELGETAFTKQ